MSVRLKMLLTVLPLLVATVFVGGVISSASARTGMVRIAMRLLTFKAEELSKYMNGQWDLLLKNRFADKPDFVRAAQANVGAFARSLVSDPSELILALGPGGELALSTREIDLSPEEREGLRAHQQRGASGWEEVWIERRPYVGRTFLFQPFGWYLFVTESRADFYQEIQQITRRGVWVLLAATGVAAVLLVALSQYLTGPLSKVVAAIDRITSRRQFDAQVDIEFPDEIGTLAHRFNVMSTDLSRTYAQLRDFAFREAAARKGIVQREQETLLILARAAEHRDPETAAHINRVGLYSRLLARNLGLDEYRQNLLYFASPLHDIGKLGVPDSILLKPDALTPQEFEVMKLHTTHGYEVLRDAHSAYLRAGAAIALTHHERLDGTGYPQGLAGEAIPLFGRIVGLVDVFDALTTARPYKKPWNLEDAMAYLESHKGRHFDPQLVGLFASDMGEIESIFRSHPG